MNLKEITEIIKLMEENDINEFEVERDGFRLHLRRGPASHGHEAYAAHPSVVEPHAAPRQTTEIDSSERQGEAPKELLDIVSPMVGTFYAAPSPEAPPYVRKGDAVAIGDVVCIIEAMKVMNEIKAEIEGVIAEILVENGQSVEFGQTIFRINPNG